MTLSEALHGKNVVVVCGAGGVGKTSISAALALALAADQKAIVVTIDPARRLASALGLDGLGHAESEVPLPSGSLHAAMLDMKTAWDELVDRHAPNPQTAGHIKSNVLYQGLSEHFVGSQGYMAMERLADLYDRGAYDVIVVDTPPTRSALDFLDAPGRLTSFLEGRALRAFMRPTGVGMRVLGRGATPLLAALRRITGVDLLADLSTFFQLLGGMTDDFSARAHQVQHMLTAPSTAFLLITSAQTGPIEEAIWFRRTLEESGLPFEGVVVNRVHHDLLGDAEPGALDAALIDELGGDLAERVAENVRDYHVLARRDAANIARLEAELDGRPLLLVPQLDDDVHDIAGLLKVHRYLFASDPERARLIADVVA